LKVEELHWADHPGPSAAVPKRVLLLEFLFKGPTTNQAAEDKRFLEFCDRYQAAYGATVAERLFYRLLHEGGAGRTETVVTINVVESTYIISSDPATGDLAVNFKSDRAVPVNVPLDLPKSANLGRVSAPVGAATDRRALTAIIDQFLHEHFAAANRQARLPEPRLNPDQQGHNPDYDHVGFTVSGIRGQVLKSENAWERLEISLNVVQAPAGWKLIGFVDGFYAKGLGRSEPGEDEYKQMRGGYSGPLTTFTGNLTTELQRRIEARAR
jgi:hypothetical protein